MPTQLSLLERLRRLDHTGKPLSAAALAARAKRVAPSPPPEPSPTYWRPVAVVMWESSAICTCGCILPATPELFVREAGPGGVERLRAIRSPQQYSLLPRLLEQAEPSHVTCCPHCFSTEQDYTERQLTLPFPEPLAEFNRTVDKAVGAAIALDDILGILAELAEPDVERIAAYSRESHLPDSYEFTPGDIDFTHGNNRRVHYTHSVSSDAGPELPHCYKYED